MRFGSATLVTTASMSASFTTNGVNLNQDFIYSIQANYSGINASSVAGAGTMKLQVSSDNVQINPSGPGTGDPAVNVRNWCDYTGSLSSTSSVAGSSSFMWNVLYPGYSWVRLSYVAASGTGVMTVNFSSKGG